MAKTNKEILESYDFKLVSRGDFESAGDVPNGLRDRVEGRDGAFVVYDPLDDDEGFLLVGDDAESLAAEAVSHMELEDI